MLRLLVCSPLLLWCLLLGALTRLDCLLANHYRSEQPILGCCPGLYGILGNPGSVIDEPLFGGYHDGMHAGAHMPVMGAGDMFGLGGKEINLF